LRLQWAIEIAISNGFQEYGCLPAAIRGEVHSEIPKSIKIREVTMFPVKIINEEKK